jgi:signal transduction histidine kinase
VSRLAAFRPGGCSIPLTRAVSAIGQRATVPAGYRHPVVAPRTTLDRGRRLRELIRRLRARNLRLGRARRTLEGVLEDATSALEAARGQGLVEAARLAREGERLLALENEARKKAEAADLLKDQLVATVSHELRGPLAVIAGWMRLLQAAGPELDAETLAEALAAIGRGVSTQSRLLSDLLDHSRLVTGRMELHLGPTDLLEVAETTLVGVRAAADTKGIQVDIVGGRGCMVVGDADRLQQVLWNLLFNAVKFTPQGGRIHVEVRCSARHVHLTVADSGYGIPADFLPHLFSRFRQGESASDREHHGLGLGLTLVREIVEQCGGTVGAESPGVGAGATFTVVLPRAPRDRARRAPTALPGAERPGGDRAGSGVAGSGAT